MSNFNQRPPLSIRFPGNQPTPDECCEAQFMWASHELQLRHIRCHHSLPQANFRRELNRKLNFSVDSNYSRVWLSLKKWRGYDATASIIACSSYSRKFDFIRCGFNCGPYVFACRDVLCPRCSFNHYAQPLVEELAAVATNSEQAFYLVISLSGDADETRRLIFRDASNSDLIAVKSRSLAAPCQPDNYGVEFKTQEDVDQVRLVWKLIKSVVREFIKKQQICGVVGGPELALQFAPLRVLPHTNYLFWAKSFTERDARKLRELIKYKFDNSRPLKLKRYPSIACYRLLRREDLRRVLKYSNKAIDLAGAYNRASELFNYVPSAMSSLNYEVNRFLNHLLDVFSQVRRVERYGGCHAGSRNYFGVITPRRAARRERDAERRRNSSRPQCHNQHSSGARPQKLRRSKTNRFTYWLAVVMPKPPPSQSPSQ